MRHDRVRPLDRCSEPLRPNWQLLLQIFLTGLLMPLAIWGTLFLFLYLAFRPTSR